MRVAFFHNWSWLGSALARALIDAKTDELWIIGAPSPKPERDPELIDAAKRARVFAVAPRDVRAPRFISRLRRFAPDLLVVGTFPKKLPPELLAVPRIAAVNVHASLLPRYRGALPEFWVIRNGETESGLTIHLMTERFDAGRVLAQSRFVLAPDENLLTISMRLAQVGPPLLLSLLDRYRRGEKPDGDAQEERQVSQAPAPKAEHLIVHWSEPAASIERLIRAAYPVFEVFTTLREERIVVRRIERARVAARKLIAGRGRLPPGEVLVDAWTRRLLVGTGDQPVELRAVELGTDVISGYQLATSRGVRSGEVLGARG